MKTASETIVAPKTLETRDADHVTGKYKQLNYEHMCLNGTNDTSEGSTPLITFRKTGLQPYTECDSTAITMEFHDAT